MEAQELKERIRACIMPLIQEPYYLVDIEVKPFRRKTRVAIFVDTDTGIQIDECAELSRQIGDLLDQIAELDEGYTLEVSSPGLDRPLSGERQFRKNIGRHVSVHLTGNKQLLARLEAYTGTSLQLTQLEPHPTAKGKWKETPIEVKLEDVEAIYVVVE
jgi:ribosome maturation factor RimP